MAESSASAVINSNGEVKGIPAEPGVSFADRVLRDWRRSSRSSDVITNVMPEDVMIFPDSALNVTTSELNANHVWNFMVLTRRKVLRHVSLTSESRNSPNFGLELVTDGWQRIGIGNSTEWQRPASLPEAPAGETAEGQGDGVQTKSFVRIRLLCTEYGTFSGNVFFGFDEYPAVLQRICVDCVPKSDYRRLREATEYQLSLTTNRWLDGWIRYHPFESPFVTSRDPRERDLTNIYPYPNKSNFMLTSATLTETQLNPLNYRRRLHELLTLEEIARYEQIARYNELTHLRLVSQYILNSVADGSTIAKYAPFGELFARLPVARDISEDTKSGRLFLRYCDTVLIGLLSVASDTEEVFEAHIEDKNKNEIYARLSRTCVANRQLQADTELLVQVQFAPNRLSFCELHRAIDNLQDLSLLFVEPRLNANVLDLLNMLEANGTHFALDWDWYILQAVLNKEQVRAVAIMTAPIELTLPPILLLGPFGTGKTFTIAQALRILLLNSTQHRILLCTHSNSAADLYVKDFFHEWYQDDTDKFKRLKPMRVYYKGRARNTVHPIVLEYCLTGESSCFREPTSDDVVDCGLIITTLATSHTLTGLNLVPTHIIIDEAAQALECEVLVPLSLATPKTRLIFAGDHMQLAPEIFSELASECGFGLSLLERMFRMYPEEHPCRVHLRKNYRAHADIVAFISEAFYEGRVEPAGKLLMAHPSYAFKPLTFFAVCDADVEGNESTGYVNGDEAKEIATRVAELKRLWPTERWGPYTEGSIGVLTYYGEQVHRIRRELRQRRMVDVTVERVLNAQGKQFTAVFISTVRNVQNCCRYSAERNVKDYGFLTNPRLLNTAVTRAKCFVAVVGDPVALLTIGGCKSLWRRYLELAAFHGTDKFALLRDVGAMPDPALSTTVRLNPLAQEFVPRYPPIPCIQYVPLPVPYDTIHSSPEWDQR